MQGSGRTSHLVYLESQASTSSRPRGDADPCDHGAAVTMTLPTRDGFHCLTLPRHVACPRVAGEACGHHSTRIPRPPAQLVQHYGQERGRIRSVGAVQLLVLLMLEELWTWWPDHPHH